MNQLDWIYNDGGRKAAGFKGETRDCGVRALAIAAEIPYQQALELLRSQQKDWVATSRHRHAKTARDRERSTSPMQGTWKQPFDAVLRQLGWEWRPTMRVGSGCVMHMRPSELPQGRIICRLSRHYAAVIDGVLHDTHDCSRGGTRCVYGYWRKPE